MLPSCWTRCELDSPGDPGRTGDTEHAARKAPALRVLDSEPRLSGRDSRPKHPEVCGFDSRQAHNSPPLTHYVIVRADLPRGVLGAQLVHAAGESSPGNLRPDTTAVVLSVAGELDLAELEQRLAAAGVAHRPIREPDPPWHGALMAIGLEPVADRATVRPLLRALQLLR